MQTQSVIDRQVSQTSEWQIRFRETRASRIIFLIASLVSLALGIFCLCMGFSNDPAITSHAWIFCMGIACFVIALVTFRNSLPHELHLNFHYRQYDDIFGFGPLARNESGSFDEVNSVYVRRGSDQYGNFHYAMGFAFGATSQYDQPMPYRKPNYDVIFVQNGDYLEQYAQTLAAKMGRLYTRVNW